MKTISIALLGGALALSTPALATGLQQKFQSHFQIGAALSHQQLHLDDQSFTRLLAQEFNTLTPENDMKWESLQPLPGQYQFATADRLIALAQSHQMDVVGHALVWHQQTPDWVFIDDQGKPLDRAGLLKRMQQHIHTVLGRYRGQVKGWDVVNEALNEDGSLRDSPWRRIIGDDYVLQAFRMAQEADPDIELYYNDYNLFKPEKRAGAVRLVKSLLEAGIKVSGIGIQGHYAIGYPDLSELEASIDAFAKLGVQVMITELDVSVLPFPEAAEQGADISQDLALNKRYNPYPNKLPAEIEGQLSGVYADLFALFLKYADHISRVTFWGVGDAQSWRNDWPMQGRTDYPLLLDRNLKRKPAYQAVVDLVKP